jgi:hypothetical protein
MELLGVVNDESLPDSGRLELYRHSRVYVLRLISIRMTAEFHLTEKAFSQFFNLTNQGAANERRTEVQHKDTKAKTSTKKRNK